MPTWETETDWDNNQSESGVVHESVADADHDDATIVQKGYDYSSFGEISPTPEAYWPLHEDSGSTANDVSGNNHDGSLDGVTLGATGILGSTAYSFDGTDDKVDGTTTLAHHSTFSLSFWFKTNGDTDQYILSTWGANDSSIGLNVGIGIESETLGAIQFAVRDNGGNHDIVETDDSTWDDGNWHYVTVVRDGTGVSNMSILVDGSDVNQSAVSNQGAGTDWGTDDDILIAYNNGRSEYYGGDLAEVRVDDGTVFTEAQHKTLYDVVDTDGSFTTSVKSG